MDKIIKRFEVGKTYATSSICDSNCIIAVKVLRRTAATVTVEMVRGNLGGEKVRTFKINQKKAEYFGKESIKPWGSFFMCPIIDASRAA
jgi:hypothetical protein